MDHALYVRPQSRDMENHQVFADLQQMESIAYLGSVAILRNWSPASEYIPWYRMRATIEGKAEVGWNY